jgi:hypothetical protein
MTDAGSSPAAPTNMCYNWQMKPPRYSVSRKKKPLNACLHCVAATTNAKYCCGQCKIDYEWDQTGRAAVLAGNGTVTTCRRFLIEKHGYRCDICGLSDWQNKPITLHLDHINGDSDNNQISNTRLLCPNCHSQTDTWCGRNVDWTKPKETVRNRGMRERRKEQTTEV